MHRMFTTFHKFKVFNSIIGFYAVNMMNNFIVIKESSYTFFHNQDVLKYVAPMWCCSRMAIASKSNIPHCYISSTLPSGMSFFFLKVNFSLQRFGYFLSYFFAKVFSLQLGRPSGRKLYQYFFDVWKHGFPFIPGNHSFFEFRLFGKMNSFLVFVPRDLIFLKFHNWRIQYVCVG